MTTAKQIDDLIQETQTKLDEAKPKEMTISELVQEVQDQLDKSKPNHGEEYQEEERVLINKIKAKTTIINFLTTDLEAAQKMKEYYEEQLQNARESIQHLCKK